MIRRLRFLARAGAVALVLVLLGLLSWKLIYGDSGGAAQALSEGKTPPAPSFNLPRLDRPGRLALRSLRGNVVVLNFWASWCVPCKEEAPRLERTWQRWKGKGVVFVGVDAQDLANAAKAFMRHYRISYPNVHDGSGTTLQPYGVTGFPETFFVDRAGYLTSQHITGATTVAALDASIRAALARHTSKRQ